MVDRAKVLIIDDHMVVVEGLKNALSEHPEFEVVGAAADGIEGIKLVKSLKPDIVVMDISMPNLSGVDATHEIKKLKKSTSILVFTMHSDIEHVISLFRAGVSGYVLKEEPLTDFILAMQAIRKGGNYYSQSVLKIMRSYMEELELGEGGKAKGIQNGLIRLSVREKDVFPLLADGKSIKEIADTLCISPKTVETHKYNIMQKLNAKSVTDLTKMAIQKDLIKV